MIGIKFTSLAKAATIFWTSPIVITIFAHFYLKERITIFEVISLILSFIGVVIIENPF
jgi:drug/metabolite transporter (DMT)-like permease